MRGLTLFVVAWSVGWGCGAGLSLEQGVSRCCAARLLLSMLRRHVSSRSATRALAAAVFFSARVRETVVVRACAD